MNPSDLSPAPLPDAVVLLGRGGTGAASRQSLLALTEGLTQALAPHCARVTVVTAFVDKAAPSLPEALQQCLPARRIVVLPLFSPDEPALLRWLHKLAMRWRSAQADPDVQVSFAEPLLGAAGMPGLLRDLIHQAMHAPDVADTAGDNWQHDPQAWSQVPEHQHHALVCTGPRCTALGAVAVWQSLGEAVQASTALRGRLRLLQTSCQYPCNHGPLAIVYPDGVWYGRLTPDTAAGVIEAHVLSRTVSAAHHVHGPAGRLPDL